MQESGELVLVSWFNVTVNVKHKSTDRPLFEWQQSETWSRAALSVTVLEMCSSSSIYMQNVKKFVSCVLILSQERFEPFETRPEEHPLQYYL